MIRIAAGAPSGGAARERRRACGRQPRPAAGARGGARPAPARRGVRCRPWHRGVRERVQAPALQAAASLLLNGFARGSGADVPALRSQRGHQLRAAGRAAGVGHCGMHGPSHNACPSM